MKTLGDDRGVMFSSAALFPGLAPITITGRERWHVVAVGWSREWLSFLTFIGLAPGMGFAHSVCMKGNALYRSG